MEYCKNINAIKKLSDWRRTILDVREPHLTDDSEVLLLKMIEDVIKINKEMKSLKKIMTSMIYCIDVLNF